MRRSRRLLLASLLIAMTGALGYALAGIPNVELMTISVFVSGYLLGPRLGIVVGAASSAVHSAFNPLGSALPPLLIAQVIGFAVIGWGGAVCGPRIARMRRGYMPHILSGVIGFSLTLNYDILTNIGAFLLVTGERSPSSFWKFILAGVLFMGTHIVWNTGLFAVTLKPIIGAISHHRNELS